MLQPQWLKCKKCAKLFTVSSGAWPGVGQRGHCPPPKKMWAVGKLSLNQLVEKFSSRNVTFSAEKKQLCKNLKVKLKFGAPIIFSVRNWWLSVGILPEIFSYHNLVILPFRVSSDTAYKIYYTSTQYIYSTIKRQVLRNKAQNK